MVKNRSALWPTGDIAKCTNYNDTNVTAAVADADLVVLHMGFGGKPGENVDLVNLSFYANQTRMLRSVLDANKPVVLVLFTAMPVDIAALVPHSLIKAIIQAYYPQHWGGQAIVDVLTGKHNPAGRLVATWPKRYDAALHGEIGNYTMIGTHKTYRYRYTVMAYI